METFKKREHNLDLVTLFKGIAIFMVITIHTAQPFKLTGLPEIITHMMLLGCQIFFVLSSFTLCLSFERRPQTYLVFTKRRILRLIPGYWLTIVFTQIVSFLIILLLHKDYIGVSHNPLDILANVLFLNGLTPTAANNSVVRGGWFVGTVVLLYLLFPLLYRLFSAKIVWWKKYRVFLFPLFSLFFGTIVLLTIRWIFPGFFYDHNGFLYNSFINQLSCFAIGFSLYELFKNPSKVKAPLIKAFFFFVVTTGLFTCSWEYNWMFYPFTFSAAFMYTYLHIQHQTQQAFLTKPISKFFMALGKVNFGIYLIHAFFAYELVGFSIQACNKIFPTMPSIVLFILILPVIILLSWLFGKWYETIFNWIDTHTLKRIFK